MTAADSPRLMDDAFQDALRQLVSRRKFDLWFSTIRVASISSEGVVLTVRDPFQRDWIQTYYWDVLRQAVRESLDTDAAPRLVVDDDAKTAGTNGHAAAAPPKLAPAPAEPADVTDSNHDFFVQNSDVVLNQRYTFENFVVGQSNQLAHAAALAVAEAPAGAYNPLFLHGAVGLGKTHLLQAICHRAMRAGRHLRVLYLSSETFVNQFIAAIEEGDLSRFRYKYRNVDLLLIDDIHLLANKERTQEEFFHTFNTLYNEQKQIVLSSDCQPGDIPTLRERLVSRFRWGLVAEIAPPSYETRMAILRRKARDRGQELPEEVLGHLAEHIDRNIRELEGAVTKVIGFAQLTNRGIDLDLAREALGEGNHTVQRAISVDDILAAVCEQFGVRPGDIHGRKRTASIALPRQVAVFITRQLTPLSLVEIGHRFGGRDHSTILYACTRIAEKMGEDSHFRQLVDGLIRTLRR